MKRSLILALVLTVAFAFTLTGCGDSGNSKNSSSADNEITEELSADTEPSADLQTPDQQSGEDNGDADQPNNETEKDGGKTDAPASGTPEKPAQKPSSDKNQSSAPKPSGGNSSSSSPAQSGGGSEAAAKTPSKETAQSYIGKSASSMIAAMGSPISSQYSPSCMGDGEDGELYYNGFTVYTYRENGQEKVTDVE